jgi:hypothetical protein
LTGAAVASAFYVEIIATNVTRSMHDALDTDRTVVFSVKDQMTAMRQHANAIAQFWPRCANAGRPANPKTLRFQLVNEARRTTWVVLGDIDSNINQVFFGCR